MSAGLLGGTFKNTMPATIAEQLQQDCVLSTTLLTQHGLALARLSACTTDNDFVYTVCRMHALQERI